MSTTRVRVQEQTLRVLAGNIFVAAGCSLEHADLIADALVWANLRGFDAHGVSRILRYLELFDSGESNPAPDITVDQTRSAVAIVDADSAPGPVALSTAMDHAMSLARTVGIAWVSVRGTVHTGALGYYTARAADYGMAGMGIVAGMPTLGYPGRGGAVVGTNPLSVALPAGKHQTVLLDTTTDFSAAPELLPPSVIPSHGIGGAGTSLVLELLASGLASNPIVSRFHSDKPGGRRHRQNAVLMAVDISAFVAPEEFMATVDDTLEAINRLPVADSTTDISYPGEPGVRTLQERRVDGIPLHVQLLDDLETAADKLGADVPSDFR
ncbi:lactate dehydrogenase [Rhodococcus sp. AD45-ID]|uniref:Ldh family oxidoreductase n=1 Tax=Rhodococcus TaxID=1827 RepID=UPI0005D38BC0|nr:MULTISPECIES: Ldh family oxidoreductase [unclassified Rhodococcus (in: high G+C Gram-positive bacteria)]KJF24626.1 Ureidoglycolate dehydrogenase [Rhodococcus sp. AD45]PSR42893.1 lactate dehydrogenase [Rhodococcus sp. AD45-ID]